MKKLMKGNEAIAEAAIQAGCRYFFGYPITPQNQIPEYMSKRMPQVGGCFLQAESEVAAINMVYGAAGAGARVMTSSSSPGISLKQEGISYIVGAELPCVIVNIVRGGPGLGGIQPAQSDYYQATRGGGHGDYRMCVLAPGSVQEAVTLTQDAFDIADRYRNPVMVMGDGLIGQMMEPVDMDAATGRAPAADLPGKPWAATGHTPTAEAPRAVINSLYIDPAVLEKKNLELQQKYDQMAERECRWQEEGLEDADIVLVAYGTTSRIARSAMRLCRQQGIRVGMLRPITLWPFPTQALQRTLSTASQYLCLEMSLGQMVDDVRLAVDGARPVHFYGRTGGMVPTVADMVREIQALAGVSPKGATQEGGSPMADLEKSMNDMAEQLGKAADTLGGKLNQWGQRLDEKLSDPSTAEKIESAASALGDKLSGMGQKLDDTLNSPEAAEKLEKARQGAATAATKAKDGLLKGANSLMGALGRMVETVQKDLADIEAEQAAEEEAAQAPASGATPEDASDTPKGGEA